jgi:CheY-like chemotaxis protein
VRLVDDLLDVSRISRGKLQIRKERMPLADAIHHALDVSAQAVQEQDHELIVSLPDEPLWIDADKTRLAQAISNLLSNAAKYSERGKPIWLTVTREGERAVISVKDEGIGIPLSELGHVFDLFMQVDRSLEKSQGGLGVGLSIVKSLVEMHGGAVETRSEGYGKGSEFVVRLPLVASRSERSDTGSRPIAQLASPRRVLVIDDNVDATMSLATMLKIMGNEVRTAFDGEAGFQVAEDFRPQLILLDIGMPKVNGYETCRRIRLEEWGKDITIAALTGWGQDEDKRRSRESGFNRHLVKPVEPATIEELLAEVTMAAST